MHCIYEECRTFHIVTNCYSVLSTANTQANHSPWFERDCFFSSVMAAATAYSHTVR